MNNNFIYILLVISIFSYQSIKAQNGEVIFFQVSGDTNTTIIDNFQLYPLNKAQNLIPNHSFENYKRCPREYTITPKKYFVDDWTMPTLGTPDYFNWCSREAGVPYNWSGFLLAKYGNGYIGIVSGMYKNTDGSISEKREYIQARLKYPLKKDQHYFISFSVALAQESNHAIDGMGMHLSYREIDLYNYIKSLDYQPQIENNEHNYLYNSNQWISIEAIYKAAGQEKFIILGNFKSDAQTYSKEVSDTGNLHYSYYLLDEVYVVPIEDPDKFTVPKKQHTESILFDFDNARIKKEYMVRLDAFVKNVLPCDNCEIIINGFTDSLGQNEYNHKLSLKRARNVKEYLISKGIQEKSIKISGKGALNPTADNNSEEGRSLNRRVEISVKKK